MQKKEIAGMGCLILTALIWGLAFVSQVQGMDSMSPLFFNATRFTLGALSLVPLLVALRMRQHSASGSSRVLVSGKAPTITLGDGRAIAMPSCFGNPVVIGIICGLVLFTASTTQQYGVLYCRSAGRSGFITAGSIGELIRDDTLEEVRGLPDPGLRCLVTENGGDGGNGDAS